MKKRRTAVYIMAALSLVAALLTGNALFFTLTYLLAFLLILSFAWAWSSINWVQISRVTRTRRTQVGRPLEERFVVRNKSAIPKLWLEVRDFGTLPNHLSSQAIADLGAHSSYVWRVNTICTHRGRFQLGPLRLQTSDPFGLFPMERDFPATTNIVVYPQTYPIYNFPLPMGLLPGGDALRRRTHYVTTNAAGVREYAPGDSFSRIHWRSTARRGRLIVKEFELDPLADIWIVVDMAIFSHIHGAKQPIPTPQNDIPIWMRVEEEYKLPPLTEEYTVAIAASLAQHFLQPGRGMRQNRAVGLLAYGQSHEIVQPDRGERQLNRILETLAVLRANGQVPIQDMLHAESHLLPRGTTILVVTPTTDNQWLTAVRQLGQRGLRVVTVSINPASFGGASSSVEMVNLLQGSGKMAYVVNCDDELTAVFSQPI